LTGLGQAWPVPELWALDRPVVDCPVTVVRGWRWAAAEEMKRPVMALRPRTAFTRKVPGLTSRTEVFFVDFTAASFCSLRSP